VALRFGIFLKLFFQRIAAFLFLVAWAEEARPVELMQVEEPLPAIFAPLSWTLPLEDLGALFPGARVSDDIPAWDGEEALTARMVWGLDWDLFGEASVMVAHDGAGRLRWLQIETGESREVCVSELGNAPAWCRLHFKDELLAVLDAVRRRLSEAYGPPDELRPGAGLVTDVPDPRRLTYRWQRQGFDLLLGIDLAEDGTWAVSLFAARQRRSDR